MLSQLSQCIASKAAAILNYLNQHIQVFLASQQASNQQDSNQQADGSEHQPEQLFQLMADHAPVLIWVANPAAECTYFNQTWLNFTGRSLEQEMGNGWTEGVHPEDLPNCLTTFQTAVQTRQPFSIEYRLRRATGDYRWVLDNGIPHFQGNQFTGFIGSCVDITARKQTEADLQASEEQNRAILSAIPDITTVINADGEYLSFSGSQFAGELIPLECKNAVKPNVAEVLPPRYADQVLAAIRQVITTGEMQRFEQQLQFGERIQYEEIRVVPYQADRALCLVRNISDRKQLEAQLQQREAFLQSIFHNVDLAIFVIDVTQDGDFLFVDNNPAANRITNTDPHFFRGKCLSEWSDGVLTAETYQAVRHFYQQCVATGEAIQFEETSWLHGKEEWWLARVAPVKDQQGAVTRLIVTSFSITDRKQSEIEIRKQQQQLEAIAANIPGAVFRLIYHADGSHSYPFVSAGYRTLLGVEPEQLQSNPSRHLEMVHPDDRSIYTEAVASAIMGTANSFQAEVRYILPTGEVKWIATSAQLYREANGDVIVDGIDTDITYRKQIELEISQSRDLREAIFNESADALFIVDPDTLITLDCNNRAVALFEAEEKGALINIAGNTLQRQQFTAEELEQIAAQINIQGFWSCEIEYVTLQGRYFWGNLAVKQVTVGDRRLNLVRVTDISQRKQAELALQQLNEELELRVQQRTQDLQQAYTQLQESEDRFRTLFEATPTPIQGYDQQRRVIFWNRASEALYGYSHAEAIGRRLEELIMPETMWAMALPALDAWIAGTGDPIPDGELQLRNQAGEPVEVYSSHVMLNNIAGEREMYCIDVDLRDRRLAEEALREAQQFAESIADKTPAILYIYDLINRCNLYMNAAVLDTLGYTSAEIRALSARLLPSILHPDDLEAMARHHRLVTMAQDGEDLEIEYRMRHANGEWRWFFSRDSVFKRDATGNVIQLIGAAQDITERKRLEQELRQINTELEQRVQARTVDLQQAMEAAEAASRAKTTFLANMSHELRTPLNAILGFSQLLYRDSSLSADQQEQVSIINRSGEHLLNLINDILAITKIEAGRITLSPKSFDLRLLLQDLEELFCLKSRAKGLTLKTQIDSTLPRYIRTDESKLRQVLINLLSNAIKFTTEGEVVLRVLEELPQNMSQSMSQNTQKNTPQNTFAQPLRLRFEVEDTGWGIDSTEQVAVFEPFVQTQSGQNSTEGTGLGLPISRQFVQLMGGELSFTSTLGEGSIFYFTIPVNVVEASDLELRALPRQVIGLLPDQPRYRLLVVEDNPENRQFLLQLLKSVGFEARAATNGQQAIELWSRWAPHLIWMDMRMPVMDGYAATQRIRELEQQIPDALASNLDEQEQANSSVQRATKILALTASAFEDERAAILSAGCDDFVFKPATAALLFEKLSEHLGVRYLYQQAESATETAEHQLTAEMLQIMPPDWIAELRQAARMADEELILELLAQIPPDQTQLTVALKQLVSQLRLDALIELTSELTS